jgi:hypothetical protein
VPCELCERPAADAYLCPSCEQDLTERLERLPVLYAGLGAMLAPPQGRGDGRGTALVVAPAPARLDVVDARSAFAVMPQWARALADDRHLPELTSPRRPVEAPDDLGARIGAACTALAAAREWIAASWPAAGDLAREVRDLHDDARTVLGVDDLPARMGRCPQAVDGAPCGAELLLPDGAQVLRCRWCGTTYPPGVWAALKVAQTRVFSSSASEAGAAAHPSRESATAGSR